MCVPSLAPWALCFSVSTQSPASTERMRACWVTAVWSSPGLTPDLLSLPSCLSPTVPLLRCPSPTSFPFSPLAHSLRRDMGLNMCEWTWSDVPNSPFSPTASLFALFTAGCLPLMFLWFSTSPFLQTLLSNHRSTEHCGLHPPIKPLCRTDLELLLSQHPSTSALTDFV